MISKSLIFAATLCLLVTAACGPAATNTSSPAEANTSTTGATNLPVPSVTPLQTPTTPATLPLSTPVSQPTSTISPQPDQPTSSPQSQPTSTAQNQSDCTDSASFIADVTIPDNSNVNGGASFLKTWRIRNTGTCTWNEKYSLVFANGDQMNSAASIPFKATAPGDTLDLNVNLVAPSADGAYTGNYELHNAAGQLFQIDNTRYVWVKITVGSGVAQQSPSDNTSVAQQPSTSAAGDTNTKRPGTRTAGTCTYSEDFTVENDLLSQVNAARAVYDLPPLKRNAKLSAAALSHSIDMACHSSISHDGSDGSTITGRIAAYGYNYKYWNEAIYAQPPQYGGNAQAAVQWWLNDPPHRVIILSPDAKDLGPGYAYVDGSKLGGYFTIDVGSPAQ